MSSLAQTTGNQKNAQLSTGPRTLEGKQTSSQNALKYGLTAKDVVLSFEDPSAFEALRAGLIDQWHPATVAERMLLDQVAAAEWRMMRVEAAQNGFFEEEKRSGSGMTAILLSDAIRKFQKYASTYRRAAQSASKMLEKLQKQRISASPAPVAEKIQNKPNPPQPAESTPYDVQPEDFFAPLRKLASQPIIDFTKLNPPRS